MAVVVWGIMNNYHQNEQTLLPTDDIVAEAGDVEVYDTAALIVSSEALSEQKRKKNEMPHEQESEKIKEIEHYLEKAQECIDNKYFTKPDENNALFYLKKVLAISPNNSEALKLKKNILELLQETNQQIDDNKQVKSEYKSTSIEDEAFNKVKRQNTVKAYETFINEFPNSERVSEVKKLISILKIPSLEEIINNPSIGLPFTNLLGEKKAINIPEKFLTNIYGTNLEVEGESVKGKVWTVYSDRINNFTYEKPGMNKLLRLGFLQKFYVAEIKDNWLHLVYDPDLSLDLKFSSEAISCGWIKMENLLLSEKCIVTPQSRVEKKAIIVIGYKQKFAGCFLDPAKVFNNLLIQLDQSFYYIYKNEPSCVLIGKSNRIPINNNEKNEFAGWVSKRNLFIQNDLFAIEPNCDAKAVKERANMALDLKIFVDAHSARRYKKGIGIPARSSIYSFSNDICDNINSKNQDLFTYRPLTLRSGINDFGICEVAVFKKNEYLVNQFIYEFMMGFTPYKINGAEYSLYNAAFLLSRLKLSILISDIKNIIKAMEQKQKRELLINEYLRQLAFKGFLDKNQNLELLMVEVIKTLYDYETSDKLLQYIKLKDFLNNERVKDSDFKTYIVRLKKKLIKLESIFDSNSSSRSFTINKGEVYYWIPINNLP